MRTRAKSICNIFTLIALLVSLAGAAVTYTPAYAAGVLFARPAATGSGNCSSWANACTLQSALLLSSSLQPPLSVEIWVRAGTHIPHPSNRAVPFDLLNGVAIYGGFLGTETDRDQRKPGTNITTLSGDLNGDDSLGSTGENSFHVVRSKNNNGTAILDGFTIRGGNANNETEPSGGGMLNESSNPTLSNLIFSGNFATLNTQVAKGQGGGMHNDASSPTLTNVIFSGNSAYIGGGMSGFEQSSPSLTNVTFAENSASFHGGGMANARNSPTLINVTFSGNSAQGGGGMFNSGSSPVLLNVTFSGNSAQSGGGMSNRDSSPMLINVTISENSAQSGGGMLNTNSTGNNNKPTLINTLIANSPGGGDCAGSLLNASSFNNLIEDPSTDCGLVNGVNGNITGKDPKLGPLAKNGGITRTHALMGGSPAINTGTHANCPQTDQRGVQRPWANGQCDIGAFEARTFKIKGNAGAAGVKLSYTDAGPKSVTSQPNGNYSLIVSENWTGTVKPSLPCYMFNPPKRPYDPVRANQTAQGYAPSFNPASPCAEVVIRIKGTTETLVVPKNGGERPLFAGVNNGPVLVNGTGKNNVPFITSSRVSIPGIFFSELMGLPKDSLSTKYAFPYYDSVNFKSQLRIVNVSNATTTVTVRIRNQPLTNCTPNNGPYTLAQGASVLVSCANASSNLWSAGPVVVESSGGNIIASLRVLPQSGGATVSEVIGVPEGQLAASYAFPWYDNKTLNSQLRVANVGNQATNVRLFIAGVQMQNCTSIPSMPYPYRLLPGTSVRVNCAGVNNGPLKVVGSAGRPIVAALRIIPKNGSTTSFSEVMGLPASQFATRHAFPWYDSKQRDTQLRVGNIGTAATQVRLFIGGVEMANCTAIPPKPYPYTLAADTSLSVSCPNVNKGPLRVIGVAAVPVSIVASLRILPRNASPEAVFAELMGLPLSKLATGYVLPWYDNVNFSSQLRVAVP
jgi:hypothetical protein